MRRKCVECSEPTETLRCTPCHEKIVEAGFCIKVNCTNWTEEGKLLCPRHIKRKRHKSKK